MIVGTIIVLMGILTLSGVLGQKADTATTPSSFIYSSGYASFGADFYTYVTNNAEEAASAARTIAANQTVIYGFLKLAFGLFMIAFGLFMNCFFGVKLAETKDAEHASKDNASVINTVSGQDVQCESSEAETAAAEETAEETTEETAVETTEKTIPPLSDEV